MALLDAPIAGPAPADDRTLAFDEIMDLSDRRRVLLRMVFGVDVGPGFADDVFDTRSRSGRGAGTEDDDDVRIDLRDRVPSR